MLGNFLQILRNLLEEIIVMKNKMNMYIPYY
jgi:hypothetical protein